MSIPLPVTPTVPPTRQRLLAAATRVFARDGLEGATTREIAREAAVNEVTLFRHFHTKENLLNAVLQRVLDCQVEALAAQPAAAPGDLRSGLLRHAELYEGILNQNLSLIITLIGEIHRHHDQEVEVVRGILLPVREQLLALLEEARRDGTIRADVELPIAADLLNAMIFTAVLRRASPCPPLDYSRDDYLKTCIDVFARGIEAARGA
jgi:AcrR family transcriptional regulator